MATFVLIIQLLVLLLLIAMSAFFSSAETTLFSLSALQVQRLRNRNAIGGTRVAELLRQPQRVLATLLVGNTLVNVAIASIGYAIIDNVAVLRAYSAVIAIPTMTVILLIFGEVAPKRLAISQAERLAPLFSYLLLFWMRLLAPLRATLEAFSSRLQRLLRPERRTLSDEELLTAVELGAESGALDEEERSMVHGIMRLSEMQASDVMTPRVDMIGLDLSEPPEALLEQARRTRYHFLPVYRHTPDAIEGFLDVTRYLLDPTHDLRRSVSPALFVPETVALDDLLITLQRNRRHVACVLDEYGGTAGLVVRGDILEIITGEIPLGASQETPEVQQLDEHLWLIDGSASLETINHELDLDLKAEGVDRIAGWVTAQAGRFLRAGESVEAQGCRVQVRRLRKLRIEQVLLTRLARQNDAPHDDDNDENDAGDDLASERDR
ncbi:MAG: hemolysin family protein, partial [Kiritimatiellae bacterium]|nr:hemolysin family protein [Kiritimatiellia bacterium]